MMMYPRGSWTESVISIRTNISKMWFGRGYRIWNVVKYEVMWSEGLDGLRSRIETEYELPTRRKTLEEAQELKRIRDTTNREEM